MPNAYPLIWPAGKIRRPAHQREDARFSKKDSKGWNRELTVADAVQRLFVQIKGYTRSGHAWRCNPDSVVVSTNVELRNDGLPRSGRRPPDDPAVAVYMTLDEVELCLACDTFRTVADNIAAIAGHVEADRKQERYGVADTAQRFAGFVALPGSLTRDCWVVLGVDRDATIAEINNAYKRARKNAHPDHGGSAEAFAEVQRAWGEVGP